MAVPIEVNDPSVAVLLCLRGTPFVSAERVALAVAMRTATEQYMHCCADYLDRPGPARLAAVRRAEAEMADAGRSLESAGFGGDAVMFCRLAMAANRGRIPAADSEAGAERRRMVNLCQS